MKIVKFKDGTYAVRKGNFITGYRYLCRIKNFYWCKLHEASNNFKQEQEIIEAWFRAVTDFGVEL